MRTQMRHFIRLTNGFSNKVDNLRHAVMLYFMHHDFGWIHQTLRVTPALEAGVTDHIWSIDQMLGLLDGAEGKVGA
jgi:hypothetical protein